MAKDKKKKKKQEGTDLDSLIKEYENLIELTKAKNQQLEGLIQEAKLGLDDINKLKEELVKRLAPLDDE